MTLASFAKPLVGALANPLTIALFIAVIAAICRAFGRKRPSLWLAIAAVAIGYLGAIAPIGDVLLSPLERRYPPQPAQSLPHVSHVVVLGSDYSPRDGIPVTAALDAEGLARIVEGVRLARQLGDVRLVVSGGTSRGGIAAAIGYADLARDLGVAQTSLVVLDTPPDTRSEAAAVAGLLGKSPFILVTSAYHMPRAMRLMAAAGARPIPAPTGQRTRLDPAWGWRSFLPTSSGLQKTEHALHEYLGLLGISLGVP